MPQPLVIPRVMTLADVRTLIRHIPAERRGMTTWRYVASQLAEAAAGAIDTAHVAVALRLVLMLEGVECPATMKPRRFPAPWTVKEMEESFFVQDATGQPLAYLYFDEHPQRRSVTKRLSRDEARRIAVNIVKLPSLLRQQ